MKAIVTIVTMGLTTALFALPPAGEYRGGGNWKQPDGATGTWNETAKFTRTKEGMTVQSRLNVLAKGNVVHKEEIDMTFVATGKEFFDIKVKNEKIGSGYCFGSVCHYDYNAKAEKGEETSHLHRRGIYKMGSSEMKTDKGMEVVAWEGNLRRVK